MSMQRQTYLALGILVEAGLILGVWISAWWLLLPAAMGLGMITAAITGTCTMTRLLGALPGNSPQSGNIAHSP